MGPWNNVSNEAAQRMQAELQQQQASCNARNTLAGTERCYAGEAAVPQPPYNMPYNIVQMIETLCQPAGEGATTEQRALYAIGAATVDAMHNAGNVISSRDHTVRALDYKLRNVQVELTNERSRYRHVHNAHCETIRSVSDNNYRLSTAFIELRNMLDGAATFEDFEAAFRARLADLGLTPEPEQAAEPEQAPPSDVKGTDAA